MKINNLLENITPTSNPDKGNGGQAPKFGRSDKVLEDDTIAETTAGCVASAETPSGGMQRRGKGSMFAGIKTSAKYPNSKAVKEGAYEDGVNDGIRGEANPRASSIYGPESGEYSRGYEDGLVKGKEQSQANVSAYQTKLAPYKDIPTEELKQMLRAIRKRSDEIQAIFNKYKGASLFGGDAPPNTEELRAEGKKNNEAWQAIHQELFQRGVPNDQRLEEADEWEEEGDKFQRFLAYAQKQLKEADPAQRISLARRLSVWQVKHFGPENNQSYNPNTGAAIQGNSNITPSIRAILEIINRPSGQTFSSTVASIPSPQQVEIDNSWRLTDEGKQWLAYAKEELQKAGVNSSDFMEVARALSQQQVKKFGRASMDTRSNITAEISMIIDKIIWESRVASQQANQNVIDAAWTVNDLMDNYNNASPEEKEVFRAGVERDYGMSVQEFFDYLQEHDQLPQARRQPEDALAEVKKANTKTARKELSKKPKAELSGKDKEAKQSESDRLWAMLQQHIADVEKKKEVKEANKFFKPGPATTGKFPEPRKPSFPGDQGSKSETLGRDGLIYHWQDPRAKQVNEKSKSQAQFRTMAAVAHNPEFAKKVGISQKVGKEFHSADRKQDYKDLPKEVDEDKIKGADGKACWTGYRYNGTEDGKDSCVKVDEAEFTEDKLASELYKDLQIFKKGADKDIGAKAKAKDIVAKEESKGLWANIHAKQNRIKNGSGERMRKPGSKGAPTAQNFKDASAKNEAANPAQQAAIAIAMKEKGQKPKNESNGEYDDEAGSVESNLLTTARAVKGLLDTIEDRDNLPEWVQEKIAKAEGMLVTSWDYLLSQKEQGIDPQVDEDWQKTNKQDKTDGMSPKAVKAYRRENPGSKLKTAVTKKPSELKAGSKDAKRRKSFCARMSGNKGPMKDEKGRPTPKAKALNRWNC